MSDLIIKKFIVAYPSGNTTGVVFDDLFTQDRAQLNASILKTWKATKPAQPEIEQCCFVTVPRSEKAIARVEMFGGEFCGNAARSVVWLATGGRDYQGFYEASGVDRPLACSVQGGQVTVEMPLPSGENLVRPVKEGTLVQLDGIVQLVVTDPTNEQTARQLLLRLLRKNTYSLSDQPAVGVTYYDQASGKAEFCVWVKAVDTIFDETACGSGTCAIGIAIAATTEQSTKLNVVQPSGETITTEALCSRGRITKSLIAGKVTVLYDGEFKLT